MLTDAQVLEEWKRRRATTWRAIRIALLVMLVCGGAFWYLSRTPTVDMNGTQLVLTFADFCVLGTAMFVVILRVNKLYRCPRCNTVPKEGWSTVGPDQIGFQSGVALNPQRCSNCGAVLRVRR